MANGNRFDEEAYNASLVGVEVPINILRGVIKYSHFCMVVELKFLIPRRCAFLVVANGESSVVHNSLCLGLVIIYCCSRWQIVDDPVDSIFFSDGLFECINLFFLERRTCKKLALRII